MTNADDPSPSLRWDDEWCNATPEWRAQKMAEWRERTRVRLVERARESTSRIMQEAVEALGFNNNGRKLIEIKMFVVDDNVFVLEAKSPRSSENNLAFSVFWSTNSREEAIEFLRNLIEEIEP